LSDSYMWCTREKGKVSRKGKGDVKGASSMARGLAGRKIRKKVKVRASVRKKGGFPSRVCKKKVVGVN